MTQVKYFVRADSRTEHCIFVAYGDSWESLIAETQFKTMIPAIIKGITEDTDYEKILVIQGKSAWRKVDEFVKGNAPKGYTEVSSI